MKYNQLGHTGLFVSGLCLGTMTFGGRGFFKAVGQMQQPEVDAMMARAFEAGINFIDTADVYSEGDAETLTGQGFRNLGVNRHDVVLATKVFGSMGPGPNNKGASRKHIIEGVKDSLRRLNTDYIDLYQIHGFDTVTPIEETMAALDTLVQHGHVRYVGVSNWPAWQIMKAQGIAERKNLHRFETLQAYYTIAGRDLEREIVPLLQDQKMGLMVWSPLAGGFLSGKYEKGPDGKATGGDGRRATFDFPPVDQARGWAVLDAMKPIAAAHQVSVAQIAIAWLLRQPVVTTVIIGAKTVAQLDDNLASTTVVLSDAELKTLTDLSALPPEYPGWMLQRQGEARRPKAFTPGDRDDKGNAVPPPVTVSKA